MSTTAARAITIMPILKLVVRLSVGKAAAPTCPPLHQMAALNRLPNTALTV